MAPTEFKYDAYRSRVERNGKTARLFTRNGHDRTTRFPWIVEAVLKNREQQFIIDGEAWCSASTACPTSTRSIRAGTTTRCSSTHSTFSRSAAKICASCRRVCARQCGLTYSTGPDTLGTLDIIRTLTCV